MITALFTLAIISYLFYILFVKGTAWGILLFIFGIVGGRLLILQYFPQTSKIVMVFMNAEISWATFIATIISILGVGYIMNQTE